MTSPAQVSDFFAAHFPAALGAGFVVEEVRADGASLSLPIRADHLRPGGTVSGPTLMTLADTATYVAVMGAVGIDRGGRAVTSSLEVHFLRRPRAARLFARCRLLKVGRRLATGSVEITADDDAEVLALCTVTYGLPTP
jgi:uncharacterized protein (TIGR00369 family)